MAKDRHKNKTPRTGGVTPHPVKAPRFTDGHIEGLPLAWRFSSCDRAGPFSWSNLQPGEKFKEVHDKMHAFENKNVAQLNDAGCHTIPVEKLEKPAIDRLKEIELDDFETLISFRFSGPERVWCIQAQNIMRVLWWDPNHEVYIVPKANDDKAKKRRRG